MIREKILNSFISSQMMGLGLQHVNSEVPKIVSERIGKRTDILGFDPIFSTPVILELKVRKDPGVVQQLQEYIELLCNKYPSLFEELNAFKQPSGFQFNYNHGIIGIVLSPEPPPSVVAEKGSTILWVQFSLDGGSFHIVDRKVLCKSSALASTLINRQVFRHQQASQYVGSSYPSLRTFVARLDEMFLSVSPTINPRPKPDHGYIAYYGTDTTRAIFGFEAGQRSAYVNATFHIEKDNHRTFLAHGAMRRISAMGLFTDKPRKDLIFPIQIDEKFAGDKARVTEALGLFKQLALFSYDIAKVLELENLRIDNSSIGGLALSKFDIGI